MQAVSSSLVFLGPWPASWNHLGALNIAYPEETPWELKPDVALLKLSQLQGFASFLEKVKQQNPFFRVVLVCDEETLDSTFYSLFNQHIFSDCLQDPTPQQVEATLILALEHTQTQKQNLDLESLVQQQTEQLRKSQKELEERVEKRSRHLLDSRAKLVQTNLRIEGFRKALVAAFRASNLSELENYLNVSLAEIVKTAWVKIVFEAEAEAFEKQLSQELNYNFLKLSLYNNQDQMGLIFFMKPAPLKFTKEERDLLDRVAEAVALSIQRLHKLDESRAVKLQWESTFDAISEPLVLISETYEVLQGNASFDKVRNAQGKGQKCYELLFARQAPCPGCKLGESFQVEDQQLRSFDVKSQRIYLESSREPAFVNLYRDVTEELQIEQQILESARRAELGIISSSIAHELNNPLGGMLTFAQLIKMELPKDHVFFQDIVDIEVGINKCKDIVQNLLNFARKPDDSDSEAFALQPAIEEAISLLELQTKAYGIAIQRKFFEAPLVLKGQKHFLIQSMTSLLQRSMNFIIAKKRQYPQHKGQIEISIVQKDAVFCICVQDNGFSAEVQPDLNQHQDQLAKTVSQRLVKELGGRLQWDGFPDPWTRAMVCFPLSTFNP